MLLASANPTNYSIGYVDATNNMPTTTAGQTNGTQVTISSQVPTKAGYNFKGWCSSYTNTSSCSGTTYQPGATYNLSNGPITNLYAIWEADCGTQLYLMQEVDTWKACLTTTGSTIEATDMRDNKKYFVAKLADGNIWMTQNLDFEITNTPLTSNTTDLTAYDTGGYTSAAGYTEENGIIKWTPADTAKTANVTVPVSTTTGTISGLTNWTNDYHAPYSAEGGDVYVYTSSSKNADTVYTSLSSCISASHSQAECKHYHRGNYYNWSAAIANNNTNVTELTTNYNTASNSICPAGWRLPVGAKAGTFSQTNTEFAFLLKQAGIFTDYPSSVGSYFTSYSTVNGFNDIRSNPLFLVRSGYTDGTSLYLSGTNGGYWSSSSLSYVYAYSLTWNSSGVYPAYDYSRSYGFNIRCIAR